MRGYQQKNFVRDALNALKFCKEYAEWTKSLIFVAEYAEYQFSSTYQRISYKISAHFSALLLEKLSAFKNPELSTFSAFHT